MATRRELLFVRSSSGALANSGSTPTWTAFALCDSAGSVVSTTGPTFTGVDTGQYEFAINLSAGQYARGQIAVTSPGVGPYVYEQYYEDLVSGGATAAEIDTLLSASHGAGAWGAGGTGARSVTVTVQDGAGSGVPGARVSAWAGTVLVAGPLVTSGSGQVTLALDDGSYTLRATLTGWSFAPVTATVSAGSLAFSVAGAMGDDGLAVAPVGLTRSVSCTAPSYGAEISGFVGGDGPIAFSRTITGVPAGRTIASALWTAKAPSLMQAADGRAVLQVALTVTDSGAGDTVGAVAWSLSAVDTKALHGQLWAYDVQITLDNGTKITPEVGTLRVADGVTQS